MKNQFLTLKKKLMEAYPFYDIDFLLDLVQSENGFLDRFPQNFEKALRSVKKILNKKEEKK